MSLPTLTLGIPVYEGVDLLDVAGPLEVFDWMKREVAGTAAVTVHVLAETTAPVRTRAGLRIIPTATFGEVQGLDVLWVPGGDVCPLYARMKDEAFLERLRKYAGGARYVASVCEGALLLAAAGLLDGYRATTHWAFIPCLAEYERIHPVGSVAEGFPRFVVDPETPGGFGTRVTGGGISSGLDESLKLVELLFGTAVAESVQVNIQYFPDPPVQGTIPGSDACPQCTPPA
jgi:transcriptional regulator GlxA family with amidase domain